MTAFDAGRRYVRLDRTDTRFHYWRKFGPELPRNDEWVVPTIIQYELARWLARELSDAEAARLVAFSTQLVVAPLTTDVATRAARFATMHRLAMADAIIYATAVDTGADLLTCDAHFADLPGVAYFRKGSAHG